MADNVNQRDKDTSPLESPSTEEVSPNCGSGTGCCDRRNDSINRRRFLQIGSAGAVSLAALRTELPVMAGPFESNEYSSVIPADKKLDPAWVESLFARGEPQVYSDPKALQHIGMPIGGICSGTLYLGGDGRLWLWDIFNRDVEGILPRAVDYQGKQIRTRNGANYVSPAPPTSTLDQGFAIQVKTAEGRVVRSLDGAGFRDITFRGEYPRAQVSYADEPVPVTVRLDAFSPFIPLMATCIRTGTGACGKLGTTWLLKNAPEAGAG